MGPSKGRGSAGEVDGRMPAKWASEVEAIKAVCGGDTEEIYHVFKSCNYDVDLTTNTLLDSARPSGFHRHRLTELPQPHEPPCAGRVSLLCCGNPSNYTGWPPPRPRGN
jgi:hypothetical protein